MLICRLCRVGLGRGGARGSAGIGPGLVTVVSYGRPLDCLVQPEVVFRIGLIVYGG